METSGLTKNNTADAVTPSGDMNGDFTRKSRMQNVCLMKLLVDEKLINGNSDHLAIVLFAFDSKANNSRSNMDYFFCNENINKGILECNSLHDVDNLSDHRPATKKQDR